MGKNKCKIIGITGGIGAGKSVVSRICRLRGFYVYDCDFQAKKLMNESENIKHCLVDRIGSPIITNNGTIDTQYLASKLFSDPELRMWLNCIVHTEVKDDIMKHYNAISTATNLFFIESAIMHTSKLDEIVDYIWLVDADVKNRIKRVCLRNNTTIKHVEARINAQLHEFDNLPSQKIMLIDNNDNDSVIKQTQYLIELINNNIK